MPDTRQASRRGWRRPVRGRERRVWGVTPPITFGFDRDVRLITKAWIALGADPSADPATWQWEEISSYVRYWDGITVTTGRQDWSSKVNPGQARLRLDNRDGRFTRRNPTSPYYGLLSRNTPIRLAVNPGDGDHTQFEGFVAEWPTRWDRTGNESTVPIQCAGPLRRLGRGQALKSTLRRIYQSTNMVAYWPLEDEGPTTKAASGLSGGRPMTSTVAMDFTTGIPGAHRVLNLVSDTFRFGDAPVNLPSTDSVQIEWTTSSDTGLDTFVMNIGGLVDPAGVEIGLIISIAAALADGTPHHYAARFVQNGADVDETLWRDGNITLSTTLTNTSITQNTGPAPRIGQESSGTVLMSHIAVYSSANLSDPASRAAAIDGYSGEQAHVRMARVCAEEGVGFFTGASTSAMLGPQPTGTLVQVLRDAEATDLGVLYERGFGLGYQALSERYNAPVAMALDWGQLAEVPEPADDDQTYINRWTVNRTAGSSATAEDTASLELDDVYDDETTVNAENDGQLGSIASWLVHRDTVDEDRWPDLELQFARNPELIATWIGLNYGARLTVADPFTQSPDDIDAFIEGQTIQWDQFLWVARVNTSPASPYTVGVYGDDPIVRRYDTAGSQTTAEFISGTDTSMTVATTLGPIWIETASHFPFNIRVSGVVLEVTAISGGSSPQTFTITQTPVNGVAKTIPVGESVSRAEPSFYGL